MQYALALTLAPAFLGVALAAPQGVTEVITPTGSAPAGCTGSFDGKFEITVAQVTEKKRSLPEKRGECGKDGILVLTLEDGTTLDAQGRTGYIADNFQFQFDDPAQTGALFTSGFSVCEDNLLALGSSKTFYRCLSGDFYNLYDRNWAEQCEAVSIVAMPCGGEDNAVQIPDGQIIGTTVVQTTIVTALSDGQPQVVTTTVGKPICQIGDGQVQDCTSITALPTSSYIPVSEYTDGQIQVTTPGPAPPAPPATTAPTAAPSIPESTVPAPTAPGTSETAPAPSSSGAGPSVYPSLTPSPSTSAPTSATSAPAETPSAPAEGGSSRAAGSAGALVVGLLVAFVCL